MESHAVSLRFLDQQLQKQAQNYCKYKPARVMICSWNIDANKPEKLVGQDDELVHEWLGQADKPDIIVVGIQEIVDLESKKQTASKYLVIVMIMKIVCEWVTYF
jgi:hypothetical protein